jgi:hypothetical protein
MQSFRFRSVDISTGNGNGNGNGNGPWSAIQRLKDSELPLFQSTGIRFYEPTSSDQLGWIQS